MDNQYGLEFSQKVGAISKEFIYDKAKQKFIETLQRDYGVEQGYVYDVCLYKSWISNQRTFIALTDQGVYLDKKLGFGSKSQEDISILKKDDFAMERVKPGFWDKVNVQKCGDFIALKASENELFKVFCAVPGQATLTYSPEATEELWKNLKD